MSKTQATFHQDHSTIKLTETQGNNASRRKWIREQSPGNIGSPRSSNGAVELLTKLQSSKNSVGKKHIGELHTSSFDELVQKRLPSRDRQRKPINEDLRESLSEQVL